MEESPLSMNGGKSGSHHRIGKRGVLYDSSVARKSGQKMTPAPVKQAQAAIIFIAFHQVAKRLRVKASATQ
jgi:hypothetical protein